MLLTSLFSRGRTLAACLLLCGSALTLRAAPITLVDTGPGASSISGWSLYDGQWLGAEFTISSAVTLNSVEGWIYGTDGSIFVHADNGSSNEGAGDGPGTLLFSGNFFGTLTPGWHGLTGLNWDLAAGTYWVVFSGDGVLGSMPGGAPSPLGNEVHTHNQGASWVSSDSLSLGVRITGTPTASVPDAAVTAGLLALALLPLLAHRRRHA